MYSVNFSFELSEDEGKFLVFLIDIERLNANRWCQLGKLENLYFLSNFFLLSI